MTAKGLLAALALLCVLLQWQGLRSRLGYQPYHQLAEEVAQGRLEPGDRPGISALLNGAAETAAGLDPQVLRTAAILHLYRVDLTAAAKGLPALMPAAEPELTAARQAAYRYLRTALARSPQDGDLWLRLALTARALDLPEDETAAYLASSVKTTPHEDWILRRRTGFDS
jgi:hypothetical protein